ncbi:MAG: glycosyltransferase [Cyanobacteria bacterium]|nr:glycosyltransferase [Cyanobacteriota bacterium]MDA0866964.1 glycosyltransferase [Cyanobacteriota bacterium]
MGAWGLGLGLGSGAIALATVFANGLFYSRFRKSLQAAPRLADQAPASTPTTVSVIIPAYNEALNLKSCVEAVLASTLPRQITLQLIIADDESTDDTAAIAASLAQSDPRVTAFTVPPRPTDIPWRGKNWACAQAVERAEGDYWLFIDADVRLRADAIATGLANAQTRGAGLLSCAPGIRCGCLAEWLVQPIMMALIAVGADFPGINDPNAVERAFAAGPFMLFRRDAYQAIGGHRGVATNPVEDVGLAKAIKQAGLTLRYVLGEGRVQVRMYPNFASLWEGWTKNFYMGMGRDLGLTLYVAFAMLLVFSTPWLALLALPGAVIWPSYGLIGTALMLVIGLGIHLKLRWAMVDQLQLPSRYLGLGWLGGLVVVAIAIASIIKTETGWGWTWRGRSLAAGSSHP